MKSVGKCVQKVEPLSTDVEMQNGAATVENSMEVPQKNKYKTTTGSSNFAFGYLLEENKILIQKYICTLCLLL